MITVLVIAYIYNFLSSIFSFIGFTDFGLLNTLIGLALTITLITLFGYATGNIVFRNLFKILEDKMEELPFIRHIYTPVKDFISGFVGNKKKFNKPVLVKLNDAMEVYELGFLTAEDMEAINLKNMVTVYLPYSYSFMGKIVIVPATSVQPVKADSADIMKFIVSGGVSNIKEEKNDPANTAHP
ncbi:MAG: DUF502 domain-containing protein [Bacteroidia bacterium]|nr:DUF502 domain-containing protein [Bacteroidia bacterium]